LLEAEPVVSEPEVFALVFAAAEPEVVSAADLEVSAPAVVSAADLEVSEPEVVSAADLEVSEPEVVSVAAEPEVFALVFAAAEPEVVSVADPEVSAPGVVSAAAEPEVFALVFAVAELSAEVVVSVADVSGPRASADIAAAFAVLAPVSVVAVEVDNPGRPKFLAFPNVDHYASSSSFVEVVGWEPFHSSTRVRTNYGLCSILSSLGLHQNRSLEHCYNNPSPGYNNASDTNNLPRDATTSRSRRTSLHLYREQRRHRSYQASLSHPEAPEIRWAAAEGCSR
jgi:hypothetical protein